MLNIIVKFFKELLIILKRISVPDIVSLVYRMDESFEVDRSCNITIQPYKDENNNIIPINIIVKFGNSSSVNQAEIMRDDIMNQNVYKCCFILSPGEYVFVVARTADKDKRPLLLTDISLINLPMFNNT